MIANPRIIILLVFLIFFKNSTSAQELWGMTQYGGRDNKGVIFRMDENASGHEVVFSFESMGMPEGRMAEFTDGTFYGMTTNGGKNGLGVVYKFDPENGGFTKIVDFEGLSNGSDGAGSMILAPNNKFYGMTVTGGEYDKGIIFEFDPATEEIIKLVSFNGTDRGSEPLGSFLEGPDGNLYGMTSMGGEHDMGVLFTYNYHTHSFEKLFDFSGEATGSHPMGSLTEASDDNLYGMTRWGGVNDQGVIFKVMPESKEVEVVFEFDDPDTGRNPQGTLLEASNGKLYGTTAFGGEASLGTLFEFDYTSKTFVKIRDFVDPFFRLSGSLAEVGDNRLFGVNYSSYNDTYVLLEYNLSSGSTFNYAGSDDGLRDFYGNAESMTVSSDGKLYFWGRDEFYIDEEIFLFEFDPEQNVITDHFKNSTFFTGSYPHGDLVQAANGKLYATTLRGGKFDAGTLLEIDPEINTFSKIFDFEDEHKGAAPLGSLILYNDSLLYGMTSEGGAHGNGVLYKYNLTTKSYSKLIDFNGLDNGRNPQGNLLIAKNGIMYGMTPRGGSHDLGVLFQYDPETGILTKIMNFIGSVNGSNPYGSLFEASNGKLYGVTENSLFEYDYEANAFLKLKDKGGHFGEIIQASDNHLYFSAYSAVYEYDPDLQELLAIDIPGVVGFAGRLLEYTPGKLIGMTYGELTFHQGIENSGSIFELDLESGNTEVKVDFEGHDGRHPNNSGLLKINALSDTLLACKPHTLYLDETGQASLDPTDIYNGVPSEQYSLAIDRSEFSCEDVGEHVVVLRVTDADGIETTCNATVTVVDTIAPVLTCPDDIIVYLDPYKQEYVVDNTDFDATAEDNCSVESLTFKVNDGVTGNASSLDGYSFEAGTYTIKWVATDNSNNVAECTSVFTVRKRTTSVVIHEVEVIPDKQILYIEASLIDDLLSEGIGGKTLVIDAMGVTEYAVTDEEGIAVVEIPVGEVYTASSDVSVVFEEDEVYTGSASGQGLVTATKDIALSEVSAFPNPFSERLNIRFYAPESARARIDIFDPSGRIVKTVFNRQVEAGMVYTAEFMPDDVSVSHFIYRIQIGSYSHSGKVIPGKN